MSYWQAIAAVFGLFSYLMLLVAWAQRRSNPKS